MNEMKWFTYIILFDPHNDSVTWLIIFCHFTDDNTIG